MRFESFLFGEILNLWCNIFCDCKGVYAYAVEGLEGSG